MKNIFAPRIELRHLGCQFQVLPTKLHWARAKAAVYRVLPPQLHKPGRCRPRQRVRCASARRSGHASRLNRRTSWRDMAPFVPMDTDMIVLPDDGTSAAPYPSAIQPAASTKNNKKHPQNAGGVSSKSGKFKNNENAPDLATLAIINDATQASAQCALALTSAGGAGPNDKLHPPNCKAAILTGTATLPEQQETRQPARPPQTTKSTPRSPGGQRMPKPPAQHLSANTNTPAATTQKAACNLFASTHRHSTEPHINDRLQPEREG